MEIEENINRLINRRMELTNSLEINNTVFFGRGRLVTRLTILYIYIDMVNRTCMLIVLL